MIHKLLYFLLLVSLPVFGLDTIQVDEFTQEINISKNLEYYLDESKQWRIEEILKLHKRFQPNKKDFLDLDFKDSSIWLQFKIKNNSEKFLKFYLTIPLPALDYAEFFFRSNQTRKWLSEVAGDTIPLNKWSNPKFIHPTFIIELPKQATRLYLIELKATSYIRSPILLQNETKKLSFQNIFLFTERLFYFIVSFLIIIGVYLYFKFKQEVTIFSLLAMIFYYLNTWIIQGTGYRWLWPNSPDLQNRSQIFFISLTLVMASQCVKTILSKGFLCSFCKNILETIIIAFLCLAILCIMGTKIQLRIYVFNFLFFVFTIINILLFYRVLLVKKRSSQFYFLLGVLGITCLGILSSLIIFGIVSYSSFIMYSITFFSPVSFIIILFSLWMYGKEELLHST